MDEGVGQGPGPLERARALLDLGRPAQAVPLLADALRLKPGDTTVLCYLSLAHSNLGEHARMLDYADQAVASDPRGEWGHRLRSVALTALGRHAAALDASSEALRLSPRDPLGLATRFDALVGLRRFAEAQACALERREIAPGDPLSHRLVASAAYHQRRWVEAETHYRAALELEPRSAKGLQGLALSLVHQWRLGEAMEALRQALHSDPTSPQLRQNVAFAARRRPRWALFTVLGAIVASTALVHFGGAWVGAGGALLVTALLGWLVFSVVWRRRLPAEVRQVLRDQARTQVDPRILAARRRAKVWAFAAAGGWIMLMVVLSQLGRHR